jgi:hypothetical protein
MTVAAVGLFVAVWRAWGPRACAGLGRSAAVAIGSAALWAGAGRALAAALHPGGLAAGGAVAVLVAIVVAALCAVSIWIGDRESARLVLARLPRRAG